MAGTGNDWNRRTSLIAFLFRQHIPIIVSQMGNLLRAASALLNDELDYFIKYSYFRLFLAVVLFTYISNVSMYM